MDTKDKGSNTLIFLDTWSRFGRKMLVVSTSINLKYLAEGLNTVLKTKLMNGV